MTAKTLPHNRVLDVFTPANQLGAKLGRLTTDFQLRQKVDHAKEQRHGFLRGQEKQAIEFFNAAQKQWETKKNGKGEKRKVREEKGYFDSQDLVHKSEAKHLFFSL